MHSKKPSMRWGLDRVSLHRLWTLNTEEHVGGQHGNMMRSDIVTYPSNHACQHIITILIPLLFYNLIIGLLSFIGITGNGLHQLFCQWCQINVIITNIAFFHCLQPNQQLHDSKMNKCDVRNDDIDLAPLRSEEHTSELQSRQYLVCRLLLDKKTKT